MKRLLFLAVGPFYYPQQIPTVERFGLLSQSYRGDVLAIVNEAQYRHADIVKFRFRGLFLSARTRYSTIRRGLAYAAFALSTALRRHYFEQRYDAVIAPEPLITGPIALAISRLTGAKAIIEVNGQYESAFRLNDGVVTTKERLKERYARTMVMFVLRRAAAVRLLYRDQLKTLEATKPLDNCVAFPEFVPVGRFCSDGSDGKYILFIGYPWFLKGVDVLIKAFNQVCDEFPDHRLKVVGYCPDPAEFIAMAAGNPRVEFCKPVEYDEVIELMAHASVFVLPSRTEAMGRVLLEAMASRKPVIGSNVDGIPYVIQDGVTGLLFESGNAEDLADKLRRVLGNPEFAGRLADAGYREVTARMAEPNYLAAFEHMIEQATSGRRQPTESMAGER